MKIACLTLVVIASAVFNGAHHVVAQDDGPQFVTKQLQPASVFHGSRNTGNATSQSRAPAPRVLPGLGGQQNLAARNTRSGNQTAPQTGTANQGQQKTTRLVFDQYGRPIVLQLDPALDPFRNPNAEQRPKTPEELARERAALQSQRFFRDIYGSRRSTYNQNQHNYSYHNINRNNQNRHGYSPTDYSRHNQNYRPSFHNQNNYNQSRQGYNFHLQGTSHNTCSHLWR